MSNESIIPTPATPDVCTQALLIEGEDISGQFQILAVTVSLEINRIPSATVQLKDGEAAKATFTASNAEHFIPGKQIEIQLGYRSRNTTVFKGIIVKHSIKIRKNESLLILEARHEAVKMTCGTNSRYYTDTKDSRIMEEVIGLYGLTNKVAATAPEVKEVVQYEASDWDFLLCRAEANGYVVVVADDGITIGKPATDRAPVVQVRYGATLLELDAEIDARLQSKGIKATAWSAADQDVIEADAAEPSTMTGGNLAHTDLSEVMADDNEIRHGGAMTQPELKAWADARLLKERLAKIRGRAKFQGLADVKPGAVVEVTGIGERFEGRLYVSGVRHMVAGGNWETDVQFGLNPELFAETYNLRPLPAAGLLPAVSGLQMGVVTALQDDPDGADRIKVRLPLISMADEAGVWARLATLDAGRERGTFFRPDVGDEVLVGFLGDDPRFPVVLGMCHSSAKPAPEPAKEGNHRKGYVSREKMAFTFDDEKKIVVLETPGGNSLTLSEDEQAILIVDQNGNKVTLNSDGITLESVKDIILKATGDVKIEGLNTEIKAQTGFKAEGSASAEVSGASTTIKGSASTTIKGGVVQIN